MLLNSPILSQEWRFCKIGKNKTPFEKNWPNRPYKASAIKFGSRTESAGVLCGPLSGGLIVIDIDGPMAEAKWESLGEAPISVSWTSGKPHRRAIAFWAYEEDWELIATTNLLRGTPGQELVAQWTGQQAVILGAHPETGGYRWVNSPEDTEIAIAPDWLTDLMTRKPRESVVDDLDSLLNGDHITAKEMLTRIPTVPYAEDYNTWVKVGAALNAVSEMTGVDLFEDWVNWSGRAQNCCSLEEYEYKWDTFRREPNGEHSAGLGSLIYFAEQAEEGNDFKAEDLPEEQALESPLNVSLEELKENWYYVAIENKYCHIQCPLQLLAPVNLNTRFKKEGIKNAANKIKKSVDSINWYPGKPVIYTDTGNRVLNLHRNYPVGKPGDVGLFKQLVEYLFPREAELIYDFMAFTLQYPGEKVNFAPYMVGRQGVGKNFIWEPVKQALRQEFHCIHNDNRQQSQYNDYLLGRKLVIIDEPMNMAGSRFTIANELKGLIATTGKDDRLHINGKYRSYIEQVHLTNFVILTNFADAIQVKGERRFYPCYSNADPKPREFYNQFNRWLSSGGTDAVIHWLNQRDLSKFDPKIPPITTDSLEDVVADSKTEVAEALDEFITEHKAVAFAECRMLVKHLLNNRGAVDLITKNNIHELGHKYKGGRLGEKCVKVNGKVINFRLVHTADTDFDEAFELMKEYLRKHEGTRPWPSGIQLPMF